jgi:hypothetical protein
VLLGAGMEMIPLQTEHRAFTPEGGTFAGSTRKTERQSGQLTFISELPPSVPPCEASFLNYLHLYRRAKLHSFSPTMRASRIAGSGSCGVMRSSLRRSTVYTDPGRLFA